MDGRTYKSHPVFYRTLSPSGPLPCFLSLPFTIMQSKASGIADHILPLGDLFVIIPERVIIEETSKGAIGVKISVIRVFVEIPIVEKNRRTRVRKMHGFLRVGNGQHWKMLMIARIQAIGLCLGLLLLLMLLLWLLMW